MQCNLCKFVWCVMLCLVMSFYVVACNVCVYVTYVYVYIYIFVNVHIYVCVYAYVYV